MTTDSIATATMTPIGTTTLVRMWLRPMLRGSPGVGGVLAKYALPESRGPQNRAQMIAFGLRQPRPSTS
jgi:hypothetical protein